MAKDSEAGGNVPDPDNSSHMDHPSLALFPELAAEGRLPRISLVHGVLFDLNGTLAYLTRPLEELMEEGARNAAAYLRSQNMDLPPDFWHNIVEARKFAEIKSEEEREEHIADDALSFLLQFFGYPASQMDPAILHRAVDTFYAPEMTAWMLYPHAFDTLAALRTAGYRIGVVANYSCDRIFQRTVDYLGLRPYLDLCLTSAGVEYRKPDTAIFDIVLKQWDVLPYELVIAGSSLTHDVAAGLTLGAMTVLARRDTNPPAQTGDRDEQIAPGADRPAPDASITDLMQLPGIVAKWAST